MSRVLLIFSLLLTAALPLFAADPSEQFLSAYQSYQQGESLERGGNTAEALNKYRFAESLLVGISKSDPSWQKPVIEYRLKKTHEALDRLQGGAADSGSGTDTTLATMPAAEPTPSSDSADSPRKPVKNSFVGPSISITPPSGSPKGASVVSTAPNAETKRLRRTVEDLKSQLQEANDALTSQKRRAGDLENADWVKKRSQLENDLDLAKRKISDLESDLKSRDAWGVQLKDLQKKLDDSVADRLASEEQYQGSFKKIGSENVALVKQLQDAQNKLANTTDTKQKLEQLTREMEQGKEAYTQLQAKLDHSEQSSKQSLAKNEVLQKQLADSVADRLASEEQYQGSFKKLGSENASLLKQLQDAQNKLANTTDTKQKLEQLTREMEQGKEAYTQLQAKLDHSEQSSKQSLAKNEVLQKQLTETSEKLLVAQKQVEVAAPLRDKIKELQTKFDQANEVVKREPALRADLQTLQEDRDRLAQKVTELGVVAQEAAKVKGLTDETALLNKTVAELKAQRDIGESELAKMRAQAAASEKAAAETNSLELKVIANANADQAVLQEEKERLLAKLNKASLWINALKSTADTLPLMKKNIDQLKSQLDENSKSLDQTAAKLAEAQNSVTALKDESQRKDGAAKKLSALLSQQNNDLQTQLKAALGQIAASVDHAPESAVLQDQVKKLQEQMDLNAKVLAESQRQFAEYAKEQPGQQKALTEAQTQANKLKEQLAAANQQITTLKENGGESAAHLKELQDQLAERDSKIAKLRKKKGGAADDQLVQENDLLRGIVLREIKDEVKKSQAHRLMQEELKRLNVQSDTLQQQMTQLAAPAVELTPQERALFKDAQLVVTDQVGGAVEASISAPMGSILTNNASDSEALLVGHVTNNASVSNNELKSITNAQPVVPMPGKFKELLTQAKDEFDRQDYLQAEETFQKALKLSPSDYFALSNYGVVEFQLGKMKEAEEVLKKASEQSSSSSFALTTLGIVHYRQQRSKEAETVLRKAIAIDGKDFTAHNYLGIVLAAAGKGSAGESELMKAVEINPSYADAHFNLAVIYATGKPPAKMLARKHYSKALELGSPPDASLEHMLQ